MASSINYTSLLGLAQPVVGQEAGTWGDDVNLGLTNYLDSAIAGTLTVSSSSDLNLSVSNYSTVNPNLGSTSAQYMIISCTANLSAVQHINIPQTSKMYLVFNATTGSSNNINVRGYTGGTYTTGVTLLPGERAVVAYSTAVSDVVKVSSNFFNAQTGAFTSGGLAYANTSSTLAISSALTQYGVLYGGGAGAAPSVTAVGATNQLLIGNTGAAPSWANLSSVTVGTATNATNATNLSGTTQYSLPYQSGSGSTSYIAPGTNGYVLRSFSTSGAPYWDSALNLYAGGVNVNNGVVSNNYSLALITAGGGGTQVVYAGTTGAYNPYTNILSVAGINLINTNAISSSTLNDYEVGTWTPTFSSQNNATAISRNGTQYYTKIGNQVTLFGNFLFTVISNNILTDFQFTLPFIANSVFANGSGCVEDTTGANGSVSVFYGTTSKAYITFPAASALVSGSDKVYFSFSYQATF